MGDWGGSLQEAVFELGLTDDWKGLCDRESMLYLLLWSSVGDCGDTGSRFKGRKALASESQACLGSTLTFSRLLCPQE